MTEPRPEGEQTTLRPREAPVTYQPAYRPTTVGAAEAGSASS